MQSYNALLAAIIAREIIHNKSTKKWATLNADAHEEITHMSTPTSSTLNGDGKGQPRVAIGRPTTLLSPAKLAGSPSTDSINSGFNVGSQVPTPVAKPVGSRTVEGSTPGDHRAPNTGAGVTDQFKNQGGPREQMRGQQNSRSYDESGRGFQSNDASDSDAGN